jgi:hypothetical protein
MLGVEFLRRMHKPSAYLEYDLENAELLDVADGIHPMVGNNRENIATSSKIISGGLDSSSKAASRSSNWQFRFLIIGSVLYILWQIVEMYCRRPDSLF